MKTSSGDKLTVATKIGGRFPRNHMAGMANGYSLGVTSYVLIGVVTDRGNCDGAGTYRCPLIIPRKDEGINYKFQ